MRFRFSLICVLGAGLPIEAAACGNGDDATSKLPPLSDGGADATKAEDATVSTDATGSTDSGDGAVGLVDAKITDGLVTQFAQIRVANWSAGAPPADLCLSPHGKGSYSGPLLRNFATALDDAGLIDAGSGAVPFPLVSSYLLVPPATYDVRLVTGGAVNCSVGIIPDITTLPPLVVGAAQTLALMGANHAQGAEPALSIRGFADDTAGNGAVALRVINASPDLPRVDLAKDGVPLLVGIPFGATGDAGAPDAGRLIVDPNGYLRVGALSGTTFIAQSTNAGSDAGSSAAAANISAASGAVLTIVIVGTAGLSLTDAGAIAAQLVECVDNAGTVGALGSCTLITP